MKEKAGVCGASQISDIIAVALGAGTAALLGHRTKNVEELADAFGFRRAGNGIELCKRGPDES